MPGLANDENAEKVDERRFFFVHLMKTGGTSFRVQLRKQFQAQEFFRASSIGVTRGTSPYTSALRGCFGSHRSAAPPYASIPATSPSSRPNYWTPTS